MKKLITSFLIVVIYFSPAQAQHDGHNHSSEGHKAEQSTSQTIWTCSMHAQIHLAKPGKCPICHMDLIPVETGMDEESEEGTTSFVIGDRAAKLMEVTTSVVEQKWVEQLVRLVGIIDYDETQVKHITAWVPGRIDRMFVDYTGIEVRENDHMVYIYSPELVSAQEELVQAARSLGRMGQSGGLVKQSTSRSLNSAREKLKLLGLTPAQVSQIEKRGSAADQVTIYAPMGGTVVEKHVSEGMYVQTGSRIYTIADLDHLWINLDAYESDLPWIKYGQKVIFSAAALPGEKFNGVVSFVHPMLNEKTRTVKVRVNVDNSSNRLKPGMFVTANVSSRIDSDGDVVSVSHAGKFVCPMHPEVVKDEGGNCPVCGMALVDAESLPFVGKPKDHPSLAPTVIPASAPLITGTRAVVYVKHPDKHSYEGREVVLGPRAGDYYLVKSGLSVGEQVVTNGAFKLDADLQIRGKKSMMNPGGGATVSGHQH